MLHLEITEVELIHRNFANNDYQQDSRVLYTFVSKKSIGQLLDISPKQIIFLKNFSLIIFIYLRMVYYQNSKPLEIQGSVNITLNWLHKTILHLRHVFQIS